jgi:hypothetical protein
MMSVWHLTQYTKFCLTLRKYSSVLYEDVRQTIAFIFCSLAGYIITLSRYFGAKRPFSHATRRLILKF